MTGDPNDPKDLKRTISIMNDILKGINPISWEEFRKSEYYEIMAGKWKAPVASVYRATFLEENDQQINNVSRYSFPPKDLCTVPGRCNVPGLPAFYCSPDLVGAIQETILTRKSSSILTDYKYIIHVSEWKMQLRNSIFIYDVAHKYPFKEISEINAWRRIFHDKLTELFRSKLGIGFSSEYSATLMYGSLVNNERHQIMENGCQLIRYPTVAKDGKFTNYAINPNLINNEDIIFKKVFKLRIPVENWLEIIQHHDQLPVDLLAVGTSKNNDILEWRPPNRTDVSSFVGAI